MSEVRFFSSWVCPFAQRAWIALEMKGVQYEYVPIDLNAKSKEFLAINPRGLVPALLHKEKPLYESMVLLEYIDEAFEGNSILPSDPYLRAFSRIWADYINKKIVPSFYKLLTSQNSEEQELEKASLLSYYKELSQAMSDDGPFFLGSKFSFLDIVLVPWYARHFVLEHYRSFTLPADSDFKRFEDWGAACLDVSWVKTTLQDKEKLIGSYAKYADNTASSQVAQAIKLGKGLP